MNVPDPTFRLKEPATVEDQIELFKNQMLIEQDECDRIKTNIINDLKPVLSETFGPCQVYIFGSMHTGLALKGSDLDVNVGLDQFIYPRGKLISKYEKQHRVYLCSKALYSNRNFSCTNPICDAKVPVVNTTHVSTKIECDISFENSLGVEASRLLHYYLNLHPKFLDVMLLIKFWAKKHGIWSGRVCIASYGWCLLFIGYLQTLRCSDGTPIVSSVFEMQKNHTQIKEVEGCRVDFESKCTSAPLPDDDSRFTDLGLLSGFFAYYKRFSFQEDVVCPYLGMPISRSKTFLGSVTNEVLEHVANLRACLNKVVGGCGMRRRLPSPKYRYLRIIQEPFDHSDFLVCPSNSLPKVFSCIAAATEVFQEHFQMHREEKSRLLEKLFQ